MLIPYSEYITKYKKLAIHPLSHCYISIDSKGNALGFMSIDFTTNMILDSQEIIINDIKCESFAPNTLYSWDLIKFVWTIQNKLHNITKIKFNLNKQDTKNFNLFSKLNKKFFKEFELKYWVNLNDEEVCVIYWKGAGV